MSWSLYCLFESHSQPVLPPVLSTDVHPDGDTDGVSEPQCFCLSGHALYAKGVHHHLPPRAERPQT